MAVCAQGCAASTLLSPTLSLRPSLHARTLDCLQRQTRGGGRLHSYAHPCSASRQVYHEHLLPLLTLLLLLLLLQLLLL